MIHSAPSATISSFWSVLCQFVIFLSPQFSNKLQTFNLLISIIILYCLILYVFVVYFVLEVFLNPSTHDRLVDKGLRLFSWRPSIFLSKFILLCINLCFWYLMEKVYQYLVQISFISSTRRRVYYSDFVWMIEITPMLCFKLHQCCIRPSVYFKVECVMQQRFTIYSKMLNCPNKLILFRPFSYCSSFQTLTFQKPFLLPNCRVYLLKRSKNTLFWQYISKHQEVNIFWRLRSDDHSAKEPGSKKVFFYLPENKEQYPQHKNVYILEKTKSWFFR